MGMKTNSADWPIISTYYGGKEPTPHEAMRKAVIRARQCEALGKITYLDDEQYRQALQEAIPETQRIDRNNIDGGIEYILYLADDVKFYAWHPSPPITTP